MIQLKRAYEPAEESDGYRVLVERLWPRGLRKANAHLDDWLKDVAPSQSWAEIIAAIESTLSITRGGST
jgi:uncharacterized protein YeaO (DUF488 family)